MALVNFTLKHKVTKMATGWTVLI